MGALPDPATVHHALQILQRHANETPMLETRRYASTRAFHELRHPNDSLGDEVHAMPRHVAFRVGLASVAEYIVVVKVAELTTGRRLYVANEARMMRVHLLCLYQAGASVPPLPAASEKSSELSIASYWSETACTTRFVFVWCKSAAKHVTFMSALSAANGTKAEIHVGARAKMYE